METDRKEYLQRPLIEDVIYEITDNLIRVSNSNTLFINLTKRNRIQLAEVENSSASYGKSQRIIPNSN